MEGVDVPERWQLPEPRERQLRGSGDVDGDGNVRDSKQAPGPFLSFTHAAPGAAATSTEPRHATTNGNSPKPIKSMIYGWSASASCTNTCTGGSLNVS
jgi:hypothetical protein